MAIHSLTAIISALNGPWRLGGLPFSVRISAQLTWDVAQLLSRISPLRTVLLDPRVSS